MPRMTAAGRDPRSAANERATPRSSQETPAATSPSHSITIQTSPIFPLGRWRSLRPLAAEAFLSPAISALFFPAEVRVFLVSSGISASQTHFQPLLSQAVHDFRRRIRGGTFRRHQYLSPFPHRRRKNLVYPCRRTFEPQFGAVHLDVVDCPDLNRFVSGGDQVGERSVADTVAVFGDGERRRQFRFQQLAALFQLAPGPDDTRFGVYPFQAADIGDLAHAQPVRQPRSYLAGV